jgi:2-polyprenyl-3-methyl-5-hydroxy-6-metoxy-1,4-benzoquinol methylase
MIAEWYEDWFNTQEYLNVYRHRNESEALKHVNFIIEKTKIPSRASVLDMACGPGRHSIIFAKKGYAVTAVDLSENLLCVAGTSAQNAGLMIDFHKSDLRDIQLGRKYDLIINLFTSLGYFETDEENFRILDAAIKHLKYNGRFVIDFLNKKYLLNNLREYSEEIIGESKIIQSRNIVGERITKKIEITSGDTKKYFYESVRLFSPEELIEALNDRGLFVDRIFGDFEGSVFDPETSERIIIIAVR